LFEEEDSFYAFNMGKILAPEKKRLGNMENLRKMKFPYTLRHPSS